MRFIRSALARHRKRLNRALGKMGRPTGLEPATSGITSRRSNQLNYDRRRARGPSGGNMPASRFVSISRSSSSLLRRRQSSGPRVRSVRPRYLCGYRVTQLPCLTQGRQFKTVTVISATVFTDTAYKNRSTNYRILRQATIFLLYSPA